MANKYVMKMVEPAMFELVSSDGQYKAMVDLYEAHELVNEANKEPTPEARWTMIRAYISKLLGCNGAPIKKNQLVNFNNDVIGLASIEIELAKKNFESIACSRQSIQESQPTT